jgi:hypothetical protein
MMLWSTIVLAVFLVMVDAGNRHVPDWKDEAPACAGQLLENGICLPAVWPPAANFFAELKTPPYLLKPPAVSNISRGRQLFVDSFLVAETNAATSFHEGEYEPCPSPGPAVGADATTARLVHQRWRDGHAIQRRNVVLQQ